MAITFRAAGTVVSDWAQTVEVEPPAGVQDNDLLVIAATCNDNQTITVNELGWTDDRSLLSEASGDSAVLFAYKKASSESGNYTVDITGGTNREIRAVCLAYVGVDQTNPIDATSSTNADVSNSDTSDPALIVTATAAAWVLSIIGATQTTASPGTQPTGYSKRAEHGTTAYLGIADKEIAAAGSEDPGVWSGLGTSADSGTITAALRPAGGAPLLTGVGSSLVFGLAATVHGSGFEAAQGTGVVKISPTDNIGDAGVVTQTVTAWSATSIDITVVQSGLSLSTNVYLFVTNDSGGSNADGLVVQLSPNYELDFAELAIVTIDMAFTVVPSRPAGEGGFRSMNAWFLLR